MEKAKPSPTEVSGETERKLRRLAVVLAAQLPGDSDLAAMTLRFMADIVEGYVEPGRVVPFRGTLATR